MDAAFWARVTEAFERAVHVAPFRLPAEIDRICGYDPRLREEVESLLQAHARAGGDFLEVPVPGLDAFQDFAGPDPWIGQQIGSYHLIQQLGSGGMGDVYLARRADDEFDLQVAVKLMHRGQDSAEVVRRFKNERQILASLDHPNIARLLDGGRTQQGQLYLVMEYVRGIPITLFCDEKKLKIPDRLELIIQTCEGVQHAHRNAIIHRDLKPSNVLVVEVDGQLVPRIIDFGIAKADKPAAANQTILTRFGQFIGTPAYMSPEQADPSALGIDTRTDVYSLGVILFELLTGQLPFANERREDLPLGQLLRSMRESVPRTPSATIAVGGAAVERTAEARGTSPRQLLRQLRGDLDWITLKALAPERERRYGTAADLAADLRRYLANEAVIARPASAAYQAGKFMRRHRVGAIIAGMTIVVAVVSTIAGVIAVQKQREAQYQTRQALESQSRLLTQAAAQRLKNGDIAGAQRVILEVLTNPRFMQARPAVALSTFQDVRAADTQLAVLSGHRDSVNFADYSPDGSRVVTASLDKTARIWDARTGALMTVLSACDDYVYHAAFSPDGTRVVTTCVDKTARIWDTRSGAQLLVLSGHADGLYDAGYSPDGTRVITASFDGTAQIWDARTGARLVRLLGHAGSVNCAAYSPDSSRVVTASDDHTARVWDARTGVLLTPVMRHNGQVISAAYSPDGTRIVTASGDKTARVWDARTGAQLAVLQHGGFVYSAFYSSDGARIASASGDNLARVWDAHTYTLIGVLSGHGDAVYSAVFSPDGTHIVTGSNDGTARVWSARTRAELQTLTRNDAAINSATYSADGRQVLTASDDGTARIYDLQRGAQAATLDTRGGSVYQAAYSPDRIHIVTATDNNSARIWDATTGLSVAILTGHGGSVHSAAFSPDGARIATASSDKTARIWDAASGAQLTVLSGHGRYVNSAAYSPDGKRIVTASEDRTARVWDARTGQQMALLTGHDGKVFSAAFSPDGARIVTASEDRSARIWDSKSGAQLAMLSGHESAVYSAAYSPDGTHIVTASEDNAARIWDARTGAQLAALRGHQDKVNSARYSPDGATIVTASGDQTTRIWDAHIEASVSDQILWSLAAETDSLSDLDRTQLGIPPDVWVRQWPHPASACNQAAAAYYDPARLARGAPLEEISVETAKLVCASDAQVDRGSRSEFQLGRVMLAQGDLTNARRYLNMAVSQGYRAAQIDLADSLLGSPESEGDIHRAVSLYEQAWRDGIGVAAFRLGQLYERGLAVNSASGDIKFPALTTQAWSWYASGAAAGEPNSLARFAERAEKNALTDGGTERNADLYRAFLFYAAASERADEEAWPDSVWRHWRYRRASLARILGSEASMHDVAVAYSAVLDKWRHGDPAPWRSVVAQWGG